jgi:hypothetical protein
VGFRHLRACAGHETLRCKSGPIRSAVHPTGLFRSGTASY